MAALDELHGVICKQSQHPEVSYIIAGHSTTGASGMSSLNYTVTSAITPVATRLSIDAAQLKAPTNPSLHPHYRK